MYEKLLAPTDSAENKRKNARLIKKDEKDRLRMSFDWPFLIHVAICTVPQQAKKGKKRWLPDAHYYSVSILHQ